MRSVRSRNRADLRQDRRRRTRVDIAAALPPDLAFIAVERLTPLFVLVENGREIGRIRGYPGEDHFWGLFGALIKTLDGSGTGGERAQMLQKALRATD